MTFLRKEHSIYHTMIYFTEIAIACLNQYLVKIERTKYGSHVINLQVPSHQNVNQLFTSNQCRELAYMSLVFIIYKHIKGVTMKIMANYGNPTTKLITHKEWRTWMNGGDYYLGILRAWQIITAQLKSFYSYISTLDNKIAWLDSSCMVLLW